MIPFNYFRSSSIRKSLAKNLKFKRGNFFSISEIRTLFRVRNTKKLCKFNRQQKRFLSLHEYLSQGIMRDFGINVPRGYPAVSPDEAVEAAKKLGGDKWVVKAQILAGGRGLGHFDNGFQGGVHICKSLDEVKSIAEKMLGHKLITKQTGEKGRIVDVIYVCEVCEIKRETYFAILMDRQTNGPVVVASSKGGVNIEDTAEEDPDAILKIPVDIYEGLTKEQIKMIVNKLGFTKNPQQAETLISKLYDLFIKKDAIMLEINPLIETSNGEALCLDAKINFDDNALFRQKDIEKMRDRRQEDPREVEASKYDLNYIGLDGQIGCLVNGAGLAMATMDIIKLCGGEPANFLDVGGGASEKQVSEAFKILNEDENVHSILVNIFGGIMRCDIIAAGIINAAREIGIKKPIVVRLQGTNVEKAKELLASSEIRIITEDDLEEAARKSVEIARKRKEYIDIDASFNLPL